MKYAKAQLKAEKDERVRCGYHYYTLHRYERYYVCVR